MVKKIFISYRRDDTAPAAGRLYDRLSNLIGKDNVFLDVGVIGPGENFEEKIDTEMAKSGAVLVLIGKKWVEAAPGSDKSRLWNERDHVRTEVRAALKGKALTLPLLVDGAPMPPPDILPDDIADISRRHAPPLRFESFDSDADHIVRKALGLAPGALLWEEPSISRRIGSAAAGALLAAVCLFALALVHFAVLHRSIADSVGGDEQMETLAAVILILGLAAGFRRGSQRRSIL